MDRSVRRSRISGSLDGSEPSERAFVAAACIARETGRLLVLARMVVPSRSLQDLLVDQPLAGAHANVLEREEQDAGVDLTRVARQMRDDDGVAVETCVRRGAPAATLF
jgi:hypothetical protein